MIYQARTFECEVQKLAYAKYSLGIRMTNSGRECSHNKQIVTLSVL